LGLETQGRGSVLAPYADRYSLEWWLTVETMVEEESCYGGEKKVRRVKHKTSLT
jgi:hypothetical protein